MKTIRNKSDKALRRLKVRTPITLVDQSEEDKRIIDLVLSTLYNNSHKNSLNLETEIYQPLNIQLPHKEAERLWEVLNST